MSNHGSSGLATSCKGLRLLSIDSGGHRGLVVLYVLRAILFRYQLQQHLNEIPRPCDVFDLAGGTGSGGIIVLMLFRLRMSIDEAINAYQEFSRTAFSEKKIFFQKGEYKASRLEQAMVEVIIRYLPNLKGADEARQMLIWDEGAPKCFVCASPAHDMCNPVCFRTWETSTCTIVEAVRATSANPAFFKGVDIDKHSFIYGDLTCRNPIQWVLMEAEKLYPHRRISCVVSLGTKTPCIMRSRKPNFIQRIFPVKLLNNMAAIATDCERVSAPISERFFAFPDFYFRLNVDRGIEGMTRRQWESLDNLPALSSHYLNSFVVRRRLANLVSVLCDNPETVSTKLLMKAPIKTTGAPTGHGLRLLSIDAGGVHGLSALIMLRGLLERYREHNNLTKMPHPYEIFDLAGGTEAGGIIVLMLFRLRMSIQEAIDAYYEFSRFAFSDKKFFFQEGIYKASRLEQAMVELIRIRLKIPNAEKASQVLMRDDDNDGPKCFVCASPTDNIYNPTYFRSWERSTYTIVQVARATSTTPTLFKSTNIGEDFSRHTFVGGSLLSGNPTELVLKEAQTLFPAANVSCVVSLGTGSAAVVPFPKTPPLSRMLHSTLPFIKLIARSRIIIDIVTNSELVSTSLEHRFSNLKSFYFRLNVQGLDRIGMNEWKKSDEIRQFTLYHLLDCRVKTQMDELVDLLSKRPQILGTQFLTTLPSSFSED